MSGERDFVGYGRQPPDFEWADGRRVAVDFIINYEEGAERNLLDGDDEQEAWSEYNVRLARGQRDLVTESLYEYGSRVGIWRLLDVLDRYDITATVFACGLALERNREATAAFVERGYDFVGHGYKWIPHADLSAAEEQATIRRTIAVISELTGARIKGWFTRPPQTPRTRSLLAQEGLLFDSSAFSDDLPYFENVSGRPFLLLPYSQDVNDGRFWRGQFTTGREFGDYCDDTLTMLERAAESGRASVMSVGLHPRIIGRPGRLAGLERFIERLRTVSDVSINITRTALAEAWAGAFAPANTWNWTGGSATSGHSRRH